MIGKAQPCNSYRILSPAMREMGCLQPQGCLCFVFLRFSENIRTSSKHVHLETTSTRHAPVSTFRQLAEVRKASQDRSGGTRVVEAEKKLIICAVKKPLKLNESQDGQRRVSVDTSGLDYILTTRRELIVLFGSTQYM